METNQMNSQIPVQSQVKQKTSPKDFFLNLGAIVALYTVVGELINLLFTVINKAYPQVTAYAYPSMYSISFPVAALIIFFPIFILLSWLMGKDFVSNPEKKNLGVHKWLTYITLFLAGLAFAGDLVSVVYYFIDGQELTTGFLLKALVVLVISGLVFFYYISDARRILSSKEKIVWRSVAGVLVLGSIVWGFVVLGSPRTQQLLKYDQQKVSDLQNIKYQVESYSQTKGQLPDTLTQLSLTPGYFVVPVDSQTNTPYEYKKITETKYDLCATFNVSSDGVKNSDGVAVLQTYPVQFNGMWPHPAGHYCFEQVLTPAQYPAKVLQAI